MNELKKISWWKRLFWSWTVLATYFNNYYAQKDVATARALALLETENKGLSALIAELRAHLTEREQNLKVKDVEISLLNEHLSRIRLEKESLVNTKAEASARDQEALQRYSEKIRNLESERESLRESIAKKLQTLDKIDQTFFARGLSKGKGELGEMQLENILAKSGIDPNAWTKNLRIDNGAAHVEFAIKSGDDKKWIPIDSKVLETDLDVTGQLIIDEEYRKRVHKQAKEVHKYLNKPNTTNYGLLVLQSDAIYFSLFEKYPNFFDEINRTYQVYICSPSSFIQFAWSIARILEIYRQVHQDEKIYQEIIDLMTSIQKFGLNLSKSYASFKIAMEAHYPTVQKRQTKLARKFVKSGKVKELPVLNATPQLEDLDEIDVTSEAN